MDHSNDPIRPAGHSPSAVDDERLASFLTGVLAAHNVPQPGILAGQVTEALKITGIHITE